jgi:predicted transposase YbfD/YdcC
MIDAQQFQLTFNEWVWAVNDIIQGQVINIDGKCLRGSDDKKLGKRAIYMVSAWAVENEIVVGQRKVDEKSNEITTIPELLKILAISGCIVTIDAMGTQTNIAKTILEANADYVLSIKENQGHLFEDIATLFVVDQAQNLVVLRHIALNLLKQEKTAKGGIHAKQLQAAWNDDYLLKVLASGI